MTEQLLTRIETHHLRYAYPPGDRFRWSGGIASARLTTLIEIQTADGLIGWGSIYSHPELVEKIVNHLRPHIVGRPLPEPNVADKRVWDELYLLTRWYGRKGAALSTIGGIDTALWDISSQRAGLPLYRLLGGTSGVVPAYASALMWQESVSALKDEVRALVEKGYTSVKMRLGVSPDYDVAAVSAVREAVGSDVSIRVDGSHQYTVDQAVETSRVLDECDVAWFEEPFAPDDLGSYRELAARSSIPLAAGENEFGPSGFDELINSGAFRFVQPDVSRAGGVTVSMGVGARAALGGIEVAPHTWSDMIALIANAHVVAALDNSVVVEVDQTGNRLIDFLVSAAPPLIDGSIRLFDAPGLGVVPDPSALKEYQYDIEAGVPDGNYSDMIFGRNFREVPRVYGSPLA